ncbi:MAG: DUF3261 domain-containing protein [Rhizomicrobium sp.]
MRHRFAAIAAMLAAFWSLSLGATADEAEHSTMPLSAPIILAPGVEMQLPDLTSLNRHIEVVQSVVASYGSQSIAIEGRIDAGPDHFTMVCSDGLGRRAVTVQWTSSGVSYETAPWVPKQLRPQNMLADLVMIYWPQDALTKAMPDATITTTPTSRSIAIGGKDIANVDYAPQAGDVWFGKTTYHDPLWHYTLSIESAALEP